jgi:hypothetical protein
MVDNVCIYIYMQDDALIAAYEEFKNARRNGQPDWKAIAARMGDERLPKAYRQRYTVVLLPRRLTACANHGAWTAEEVRVCVFT